MTLIRYVVTSIISALNLVEYLQNIKTVKNVDLSISSMKCFFKRILPEDIHYKDVHFKLQAAIRCQPSKVTEIQSMINHSKPLTN